MPSHAPPRHPSHSLTPPLDRSASRGPLALSGGHGRGGVPGGEGGWLPGSLALGHSPSHGRRGRRAICRDLHETDREARQRHTSCRLVRPPTRRPRRRSRCRMRRTVAADTAAGRRSWRRAAPRSEQIGSKLQLQSACAAMRALGPRRETQQATHAPPPPSRRRFPIRRFQYRRRRSGRGPSWRWRTKGARAGRNHALGAHHPASSRVHALGLGAAVMPRGLGRDLTTNPSISINDE